MRKNWRRNIEDEEEEEEEANELVFSWFRRSTWIHARPAHGR